MAAMRIEVRFFSRLRDLAGAAEMAMDVTPGLTVGGLLEILYRRYPALREWDPHILTAVGLDYAGRDQPLQPGDTVSIMPPVQGG